MYDRYLFTMFKKILLFCNMWLQHRCYTQTSIFVYVVVVDVVAQSFDIKQTSYNNMNGVIETIH